MMKIDEQESSTIHEPTHKPWHKRINWRTVVIGILLTIIVLLLIPHFLKLVHMFNKVQRGEQKVERKWWEAQEMPLGAKRNPGFQMADAVAFKRPLNHTASQLVYEKQSIEAVYKLLGVSIKKYQKIIDGDIKELPICVLALAGSPAELQQMRQSVDQQPYSNFRFINVSSSASTFEKTTLNYYQLNRMIKKRCIQNSVLMFISEPITANTLEQLNKAYQTQSVWTTFSRDHAEFSIHSAYQRIFDMIGRNDFVLANAHDLAHANPAIITLSLIQLAAKHALELPKKSTSKSFISLLMDKKYEHNRQPYDTVDSLRHSYMINSDRQQFYWSKMQENKEKGYNSQAAFITQEDLIMAVQNQEMLYLPTNHSLFSRDRRLMQVKYSLHSYQKQLPLCVCVHSYNTFERGRYERAILSILQQNYRNYHIVFIDDFSDDYTLLGTMHIMEQRGFPQDKIMYIRNIKRNYPTYNILNAAMNYCNKKDIQVVIDGGDQLIGTQVFKIINAHYQKRDNWVVYTQHITDQFVYGSSRPLHMSDALDGDGLREKGKWICHIQTWYVALLKKIQIKDHKKQDKTWLDRLYKQAFQHPLMEMGREKHVEFVPEVCYMTNRKYDDSTEPIKDRQINTLTLHFELLARPAYKELQKLDYEYENKEVADQLNADYGVKYKQVTSDEVMSFNKNM